MKILAFGASIAGQSINKRLASYAATLVEGAEIEILDLRDYEMPLYSEDREQSSGVPAPARQFFRKIGEADALILSFAEHNGSYAAAYKNLFDWASRIDTRVFQSRPALYLSTSPGPGGASTVLGAAIESAPHFGAELVASLSVPRFHDNFDTVANTLVNLDLLRELRAATGKLHAVVANSEHGEIAQVASA